MDWGIYLIAATVLFSLSCVAALIVPNTKAGRGRLLDGTKILFFGVVISSVILFFPIYIMTMKEAGCGAFEAVLISVHNMIRLFVVDGDFAFVTDNLSGVPLWVENGYTALFAVLFVAAPLLTFGFVLSFFKNLSAYRRYFTRYYSDAYIFSELNSRSLALATDLKKNKKRTRTVVFCSVKEDDFEGDKGLIDKAYGIGAVCFEKDVSGIGFSFHSKRAELCFFCIGGQEFKNVSAALDIIEKYRMRENTQLYVFSSSDESELLLSNSYKPDSDGVLPKIHLRRVNEERSLVYRTLYETGFEKVYGGGKIKDIGALIVGMGGHGSEMLRALCWFSQMDGYSIRIDAFDSDENAESRFVSECPELMDDEHNGVEHGSEDANYKITVHSGIDVMTDKFDAIAKELCSVTYVLVALGDDEKNISAAVKLRQLFLRSGMQPAIAAVVYDTDKKNALLGVENFKGEEYGIDFIGDLETSYSENVILGSDLEKLALARHLKWGEERDFWRYDYNYKSSVASAIHTEMKKKCGIPGAELSPEMRSQADREALRRLEHRRWDAYMRSEGYVFSGSDTYRNDLAKMHNCLVDFSKLSKKDQEKDDD